MPDNKQVNRRAFFRVGLRQLLEPIAGAVEPIRQATADVDRVRRDARRADSAASRTGWLRPPGARAEADFRSTCSRSGNCVSACPAHAIKIDPTGQIGHGAPYIDADEMPCVVCSGLYCMQGCPSDALMSVPLVQINMGTAVWREDTCLRTRGEDCTICVERCPLGSAAIELAEGKIQVKESGCIGCGVCQHDCPTSPKSIVVVTSRQ